MFQKTVKFIPVFVAIFFLILVDAGPNGKIVFRLSNDLVREAKKLEVQAKLWAVYGNTKIAQTGWMPFIDSSRVAGSSSAFSTFSHSSAPGVSQQICTFDIPKGTQAWALLMKHFSSVFTHSEGTFVVELAINNVSWRCVNVTYKCGAAIRADNDRHPDEVEITLWGSHTSRCDTELPR